jgi:hypothetical protein
MEDGEAQEQNRGAEAKISLPEVIIGSIITLIFDVVEFLLVTFFFLDDFFILDILYSPMQLYLMIKGVKNTYSLIGNGIELLPYAGWLPSRSISWIMTIWVDHHPKAQKVANVAIKIKSMAAGKSAQEAIPPQGRWGKWTQEPALSPRQPRLQPSVSSLRARTNPRPASNKERYGGDSSDNGESLPLAA